MLHPLPVQIQQIGASADEWSYACKNVTAFADHFSSRDITANWEFIERPPLAGAKSAKQSYARSNVRSNGNELVIRAEKFGQDKFSAGSIHSRRSFGFGCYEFVALLPVGKGLWPAMWLRTEYGKPLDAEIDVLEGFGSHPDIYQSTIHYWRHEVHLGAKCVRIGHESEENFAYNNLCSWKPLSQPINFSTTAHKFGLIWTPYKLTWFLDGKPYFVISEDVPQIPMYIMLNLAVGGVFDGPPTDKNAFPAEFKIRSVRYFPLSVGRN